MDRWLLFMEDTPKGVLELVMKEEPAIAKAEEILEHLGSLEEIRRYYEAREMAIRDEITRITGAREEGLLAGEAKGRLEGKVEVARKMLLKNTDVNLIVETTELPLELIHRLKKEIDGEVH